MKLSTNHISFIFVLISALSFSAPLPPQPAGPPPPPGATIDSGLFLLLLVGILYVFTIIYKKNIKKGTV